VENGDLNQVKATVVSLDIYRERRAAARAATLCGPIRAKPILSDLRIAVNSAGEVIHEPMRVQKCHALAVLTVCLAISNQLLDLHFQDAI
jgi:hypothetical protein